MCGRDGDPFVKGECLFSEAQKVEGQIMSELLIRPFLKEDVPSLLILMEGLARFEGYYNDFEVNEQILIERGLSANPDFFCFVAEVNCELAGYVVGYYVPFSYRLRPTVILKELYVPENHRRSGLGKKLFQKMLHHAQQNDVEKMEWLVLPDNLPAQRFYAQHDGHQDENWQRWYINF